ncbi:MAG: hypothetical protein WCJ95_03530 [Mariniphaga sp.]
MSSSALIMKETRPGYLYVKPKSICIKPDEWEKSILRLDQKEFIKAYKEKIQDQIKSHGLNLRLAKLSDIEPVYDFIMTRFNKEYIDDVSKYDLFRFIEYGHGLIVEDSRMKILGCLFEVGYEKIWKISYSLRLGIDETLKGKGLGKLLTVYSCLLAMERGSHLKIGLISIHNLASLHIHVNQVGWLVDKFYHDLDSLGLSFEFSLPLTPEGLIRNRIDPDKVQGYLEENIEGVDYLLIDYDDVGKIKAVYNNGKFKIAAIITKDYKGDKPQFLALPVEMLYAD